MFAVNEAREMRSLRLCTYHVPARDVHKAVRRLVKRRNPTISRAKANSDQVCDKVNAHCSPHKYDFESTLVYALVLPAHVVPLSIYHPLTPSKMFQPSAIISHVPVTEYHVNLPPCYSLVG
jgi:hypothetical protein